MNKKKIIQNKTQNKTKRFITEIQKNQSKDKFVVKKSIAMLDPTKKSDKGTINNITGEKNIENNEKKSEKKSEDSIILGKLEYFNLLNNNSENNFDEFTFKNVINKKNIEKDKEKKEIYPLLSNNNSLYQKDEKSKYKIIYNKC